MSEPTIGDNLREQLKSIVSRAEAVELEIKERRSDLADIYKEADGNGFDVPALKSIVRARRETAAQRQAREAKEANVDLYRVRLGE